MCVCVCVCAKLGHILRFQGLGQWTDLLEVTVQSPTKIIQVTQEACLMESLDQLLLLCPVALLS